MRRSTSGSFFSDTGSVSKLPASEHALYKAASLFATVIYRRYREGNEVAQPVAGTFLSPRLCWNWCPLFSALGHPEAFRNYLVCWRRPFPCPACPNSRLCCWCQHAPQPGFNVSCSFGDELFKGFRRSRPGGRCDCNCDWGESRESRHSDQCRRESDQEYHRTNAEIWTGHGTHNEHEAHRSDERGHLRTSLRRELQQRT